MNADYLSSRRAVSISLLGLAIQFGIAIVLVIYARYSGGDHAAVTAAASSAIGALVWFGLIVLYDQRRRERVEALEAESLATAESAAASAFENTGDELRVAARRLALVRKFFLPGLAVVAAASLLTTGIVRIGQGVERFDPDNFVEPRLGGWGIAIGLGIAFVGFVFARFVSGMAQQKAWGALRAGASQAVGAALIGLLLAVGLFVDMAADSDWLLRALPVIFPAAMILGGAEIILNLILDAYRPRRAGEEPAPAFDSRLLGLVAAPDKIAENIGEALNYQFGVDVTGTWFYRLLSRSLAWLGLVAFIVAWGMSSLAVLQPHQRGIVLTFGEVSQPLFSLGDRTETDIGPGLHVKLPWPISRVEIPEYQSRDAAGNETLVRTTTGVQLLTLGTSPPDEGDGPILWSEQHTVDESFLVVQSTREDVITGGLRDDPDAATILSLLAVEVPVHYVVNDVQLYDQLAAPGERRRLLEAIGRQVVSRYVSALSVDQILATDRGSMADRLRSALTAEFDKLNGGAGPGIEILFVGVAGVHPPRDVAPNFERVVQGRQNREAMIEAATTQQTRTLATVAGSVELAGRIVALLDEGEDRRVGGAPDREVAELDLEVQRLLEEAGGEAGELLVNASADRWTRHMGERAKAAIFLGRLASYRAAPGIVRSGLYFDALGDALAESRVYLTPPDIENLRVMLELQDRAQGRNVFDQQAGAE
ncbi:MAG: SPFH domain-containing protein [Planctomycetota bacterium]